MHITFNYIYIYICAYMHILFYFIYNLYNIYIYLDLRAGSNFSLNAFSQEICPNLRIPPKAPNSARTHFSQKIIFVFSKNSLRPFTPESRVFPPESRAIPPEFIFPKNTALQCFRLLKLNSARRQIFCPTPPPGRLV